MAARVDVKVNDETISRAELIRRYLTANPKLMNWEIVRRINTEYGFDIRSAHISDARKVLGMEASPNNVNPRTKMKKNVSSENKTSGQVGEIGHPIAGPSIPFSVLKDVHALIRHVGKQTLLDLVNLY